MPTTRFPSVAVLSLVFTILLYCIQPRKSLLHKLPTASFRSCEIFFRCTTITFPFPSIFISSSAFYLCTYVIQKCSCTVHTISGIHLPSGPPATPSRTLPAAQHPTPDLDINLDIGTGSRAKQSSVATSIIHPIIHHCLSHSSSVLL